MPVLTERVQVLNFERLLIPTSSGDIFPCTGYKATKRLGFGNEANILHCTTMCMELIWFLFSISMVHVYTGRGNSVQCILTIKILWVTFVIL